MHKASETVLIVLNCIFRSTTTISTTTSPAPSSGRLHRKDLDGMIRYALYQEIATQPSITGSKLMALKDYIKTVAKVNESNLISQWRVQDSPKGGVNPRGGGAGIRNLLLSCPPPPYLPIYARISLFAETCMSIGGGIRVTKP